MYQENYNSNSYDTTFIKNGFSYYHKKIDENLAHMAIDIAAYVYYGRPALTASYYDGYGFLEALCQDGMAVIPDTLCVRGLATGSVSTVGGGGAG